VGYRCLLVVAAVVEVVVVVVGVNLFLRILLPIQIWLQS
jgi:hypothetical protein